MTGPQVPDPDEEALVTKAVAGDKGAFTQLYERYYDRVFRHVAYRVQSPDDAEDLTQQVFLQAWRALGRYRVRGSPFVAWLFTIAHNLVISFYRRQKTSLRFDPFDPVGEGPAAGPDPQQVAETQADQQRVRAALVQLKPEHQQVLSMRFIEDLPHRDIAAALGKSEGAVRVIQHRALRELRQVLETEEQ